MIVFALPNDPTLLTTVGKVAIRHGQLDYCLRMTIKSIERLSVAETLDAAERHGSRELRLRVRKLAKQKLGDGPALIRLDALLTRCRRATERRNQLLHGLWAVNLEDGREVFRHEGHTLLDVPQAAELEALADEFAMVASDLNEARLNGFLREALDNRRQAGLPQQDTPAAR